MNTRPSPDELVAFLRTVKHIGEADEAVLRKAERAADWLILPSRQVLMRQGELHDRVYLLLSGKLRFENRGPDGQLSAHGEILPGSLVGDVAALKDRRSVATVFSVRDSQLMSVPRESFEGLLLESPSTLLSLTSKMLQQIELSIDAASRPARAGSIAVIPLSPRVPIAKFTRALTEALSAHGRAARLAKDIVENELGAGRADLEPQDPRFAENLRWLSRFEAAHDFVLFEGELAPSPWSWQTLREADRWLFVADAGGPTDLTALEARLREASSALKPKADLILLHPAGSPPTRTASILSARAVEHHHHLCLEEKAGFARLARILSGRSVGLTLGGGGVRAAAHIGLIRAFQEAGIPIDHIGGTSIGALIAVLFARGLSPDQMEEIILTKVVGDNLFNDYTLPLLSLVRGEKLNKFLRDVISDAPIEDLALDFFAVTTNLTTNQLETWSRGPAWEAVRASMSLPGILPPFARDGGLYLDGGLLDNVPAETMRRRGAGVIIAVDVGAPVKSDADERFAAACQTTGFPPSFWELLRARFSRPRRDYPNIGDIITRSMVIGSREQLRRAQAVADVFVRLPVDNWKMLEFSATPELVQVGYRYSREHLAEWQKTLENAARGDGQSKE